MLFRSDRGAEVGDRGIDPEERRSARPVGALAGGDCDLVGALGCGVGGGGEGAQAVRVDVGAWAMWASRNAATCSALKLATTFITTYPMAPSACRSQAAITRVLPAVPRPWLRSPPRDRKSV